MTGKGGNDSHERGATQGNTGRWIPRKRVIAKSEPTGYIVNMNKISSESSTHIISVWLVEDNERFRTNIRDLIDETAGLTCGLSVSSCEAALAHLESDAAPDILLMDIGLPGMDGIEGIRRVKTVAPSIQVIMLTVFDDSDKIFEAICAGASGYLLKSAPPDDIMRSLSEILNGGAPINAQIARKMLDMFTDMATPKGNYRITDAEKEILHLLIRGNPKKHIAHDLGVSFHTVDSHLRNIYTKLHVHSRSEAVAKALKERLL
jgi:DNA-binding NarL/FixJ family response regulator